MKVKKIVIIALIVTFIILAIIGTLIYCGYKQDKAFKSFIALINEHNYEALYDTISQEAKAKITKEDFIKRNKNIYEGIDATKIEVEVTGKTKGIGKTEISYNEKIPSSAGTIEFSNKVKVVMEKMEYKIDWTSNLIFPDLNDSYKVRVSTLTAKRGEILDRNGEKLAENGEVSSAEEEEKRVYPLGKEASHLIGYISSITDKELEDNAGKGYSSGSKIGKSGAELAYEETLRGQDGKEIYIETEDGERVKTVAKQEQEDGQDVKLTIDAKMQKQLYNQMEDDKGLFVVMDPKTGELLALVSTPSYDSNDFISGMTNEKWEELNNDPAKPLYNKFTQRYCPGSTFKPITAAIGLTAGKLTPETTFNYSGLSWQKDTSWGDDKITTLKEYSGAKNIQNALINSDNIFFGQAAMQIGTETFIDGLKKIGFDEEIPDFPLSLNKSQFSNTGEIETEKKLADSGYGQGDILVNPIHMASIYSAFANNGNMVKPHILYKGEQTEYFKEGAFSEEAVEQVKDALVQVVESPNGTANDMYISGHTIAGKTGTAELKKSADDKDSGTLGWFDCFTINEPSGKDLLIVSMVENVQDNTSGGSHYLIKKIKTMF